ncbi:MAG: aldo/keto reductase, partial [Aeromicrobium sp.]
GEAFDAGETFSGVDFATGVAAAQEFVGLVPEGVHPAQAAIAWIVAQDGVTAAIPGARSVTQARSNATAAQVSLPGSFDTGVHEIYDRLLREAVHPRW